MMKVKVKINQSCLTLCNPMEKVLGFLHGILTGVGSLSFLQRKDLPNSGIKPRSSALPAEPREKPKNTGVGSLSLLQQIFLTQELNRGLLHYR